MPRTLYHIDACPFCEKVRLALALEGIEYESREIDPGDRSEVENVSGQGKVPVLVEEDGSVIMRSNSIMQMLVSSPDSVLVPSSRRDQALTWVLVDRADAILAPISYRLQRGHDPEGNELSEEDLSALRRRLREELAVMEGVLERGPFLFGERPTVADVAAHAFLNRLPDGERAPLLAELDRAAGWYERVAGAAASGRRRE
jgi:glutathione S-transferase